MSGGSFTGAFGRMIPETKSLPVPRQANSLVPSPPIVGETIGQYEIVRVIGSGGMGVVFEGFHPRLRRRVAIKVVHARSMEDRDTLARFDREMESIGRLQAQHIVQAFDAGDDNGRHFLVMEFVEGCNAEQLARHYDPLPLAEACEIVRQAAHGLQHAHQAGLIHRDVKPSNLLISEKGCVKVADLGLARNINEKNLPELTLSGAAIGTVDYMAPEQARGEKNITSSTDIYALGCTWYRLLTGCVPFHSDEYDSLVKKLLAHINDPVPPATSLRADIPSDLDDLLQSMLAKSPESRPSLYEVSRHLSSVTESANIGPLVAGLMSQSVESPSVESAKIVSQTTRTKRGRQQHRRVRWLLWVACSIVFIGATISAAWLASHYLRTDGSGTESNVDARNGVPRMEALTEVVPKKAQTIWFEDLHTDEIELGRRYSLLNKSPTALSWTQHSLAEKRFNAELRQFRVSHPDFAMFTLGSVPPAAYIFEVDLFQNRWSGGPGVFWGMQQVVGEQIETWKAQVLHFKERRIGDDIEKFPLMLCRETLRLTRDEDGSFDVQRSTLAGVTIARPPNRVQSLSLFVSDAGLVEVRWAGDELAFRPLCTFELNKELTPRDYAGEFGVYADSCELIVDTASVLLERRLSTAE